MNARKRNKRTVEHYARENFVVIRYPSGYSRVRKCGGIGTSIPLRISFRWISTLRYWYHSGSGQKMKHTIQSWAHDNALTLAFITVLFIITWGWIFIAVAFFGGSLSGE